MKTYSLRFSLFYLIYACLAIPQLFAGNIVAPWRAVKTIVQDGSSFKILYNNTNSLPIDSVILEGPFTRTILRIDSIVMSRFEFDSFTHESVNNQIWVSVPENTPEELYNLKVMSGGEIHLSPKSVHVIKEFKTRHSFIHITDLHMSRQWVGVPEKGYAKELELFDSFIKVANIISPDFIIVTGDLIHDYTRINADSTGWGGTTLTDASQRPLLEEKWRNCYEGSSGFLGLNGLNSPVFTLPGNHDFYGLKTNDYKEKATQWNNLCGLRVYGFSYEKTRIIAADDFLGDPVIDIPAVSPMSGLQGKFFESFFKENGHGAVRIMGQHRHDRIDTSFLNKHNIDILLNGHSHTPAQALLGTTPTFCTRPGVVCRSGVTETERELGFFRIFTIDNGSYSYSPPIRFCKDPTRPVQDLELNLTLDYEKLNDGTSSDNKATIKNNLGVDLSDCKVRFIMRKGNYRVKNGTIYQIIETNNLTIVDVKVDAYKGKSTNVIIARLK